MRDARTSSSAAPTAAQPDSTLVPQIRKLSWFQRTILCMKVDVHREQYMAYHRDVASSNTQKLILHHVSGSTDDPPADAPTASYENWADEDYTPWVQINEALKLTAPPGAVYAQPPLFEDEMEAAEVLQEAEGQSEDTAGESSEGNDVEE